ncbi:MAG: hypothetical protein PF961_10400 [Planctomycetota bacterium]|jgi:hypothetical protein|nr:hypothetical protein [Planctomycetota bacterium]
MRTLLLLGLILTSLTAAERFRVLVVGSAWSEQHSWPLMCAWLSATATPPTSVALRSVAATSSSLPQLIGRPVLSKQLRKQYELVLLQVHQIDAAFSPTETRAALARFAAAMRSQRVVLWHPPGPSVTPERRAALETVLDQAAADHGWERWRLDALWRNALEAGHAIEDRTGLPTQLGGYLLACAGYHLITGNGPQQLRTTIDYKDLPALRVPEETARSLHRLIIAAPH